jgi:hypothetical protein
MSHFNSRELKNGLCKSIVIANSEVAKTKLPFVEEVVVDGIVRGWNGQTEKAELVFVFAGKYDIGFNFKSETEIISVYHHDEETEKLFCALTQCLIQQAATEDGQKKIGLYLQNTIPGKANVNVNQSVG